MRIVAPLSTLGLVVCLVAVLHPTQAQEAPWKRRLRQGVVLNDSPGVDSRRPKAPLTSDEMRRLGLRPRGGGLIDLSEWPLEPPSPADVAPSELARAMQALCPTNTSASDLRKYAEAIVRYGREFTVDPWLLAALVYTQGSCTSEVDNSYGTGLTLINWGMHAPHVRKGVYHFGVWTRQGWKRAELDISAFPFERESLRRPEANLYFAAALLHVFCRQCPHLDHAFDSVPHRHPVSHFVWGDHVGDTGPEDRILTARRRLLNRYARRRHSGTPVAEVSFVSPLDGYPRVATSGLGEPRDRGRRPHRGIDFASEQGEPVRAIAGGTVRFAGVDWERRAHIPLTSWGAELVHGRHMGPRGLFVEIDHGHGVVSLYAHLAGYEVEVGDRVEAGQRIGEVGRTGVRDSGPHLHLGLFHDDQVLDPLEHLAAYVFPPTLTKRGHAGLARTYHHGHGAPGPSRRGARAKHHRRRH